MTEAQNPSIPDLPRWPFWLADAALLAVAFWVAYHGRPHFGPVHAAACVLAVAAGAFLSVSPYLIHYKSLQTQEKHEALLTALGRLDRLTEIQNSIQSASSNWQLAQESSKQIIQSCREISDKMSVEAKAFGQFLQSTQDQERAQLRLEIEKLKRSEGDWLQVCVRTLDHVYALHAAARRSQQPELATQIGNFRAACQDAARRIGLVMFEAQPGENFDARGHQPVEGGPEPAPGSIILETMGPGYTFQGQLLRRAVVTLTPTPTSDSSEPGPMA